MTSRASQTAAQAAWMKLKFGMFVHFGLGTFVGESYGESGTAPSAFAPSELDCRQWAEVASSAGARYAVLTAKHVDGFCLWPTKWSSHSVLSSPCPRDVVGEFVEAMSERGIQAGLYYCLWDRNCRFYEEDARYANYVQDQIAELLTGYGPIVELWFDGAWDKDHPTRDWPNNPEWQPDGSRYRWSELYDLVHRLQPDCLVVNNSSSDRPGGVKYHPLDLRTAERIDFEWQGRVCEPNLNPIWPGKDGRELYLPLEFSESIPSDWFFRSDDPMPTVGRVIHWKKVAAQARANLLLNVGPDQRGLIPDVQAKLLAAGSGTL